MRELNAASGVGHSVIFSSSPVHLSGQDNEELDNNFAADNSVVYSNVGRKE